MKVILRILRNKHYRSGNHETYTQREQGHNTSRENNRHKIVSGKRRFQENIYASSIILFFCLLQMTIIVSDEAYWWELEHPDLVTVAMGYKSLCWLATMNPCGLCLFETMDWEFFCCPASFNNIADSAWQPNTLWVMLPSNEGHCGWE